MQTALPVPRILARQRSTDFAAFLARTRDALAALPPVINRAAESMRAVARTVRELDLRSALARLSSWRRLYIREALDRGEQVCFVRPGPDGKIIGEPLTLAVLGDLPPPDPNGWRRRTLGDHLLERFRNAPPDPEAQAWVDAHAVDDIIGSKPGGFGHNP